MTGQGAKKKRTHDKILDSAAVLFKQEGFDGAGVDAIMAAAGLTHGGFYAHFENKAALEAETVTKALEITRRQWFSGLEDLAPAARVQSLLMRYLNAAHRDDIDSGCILPALAAEIARSDPAIRKEAGRALSAVLDALQDALEDDSERGRDLAAGILAACVGGITLARAAADAEEANRFLRGTRMIAIRAIKQLEREKKGAK